MPDHPDRPYIIDANVLIDYCDTDLRILSLLSRHINPVHIARSTFRKVEGLSRSLATSHSLVIHTPDLATVIEATKKRGPLAPDDRETLLLAKKHEWICITNDKPLRRECLLEEVPVLWGLEPMKLLVSRRLLKPTEAIRVARKIADINPGYITADITARFESQIAEVENSLRRTS